MNPDPKQKRIEDETYLDFVRDQPCLICGSGPPNDPHHLDSGVMGSKGDDWTAIPLCRHHHREYHDHGETPMERRYNVKLWKQCHRLLSRYHHNREG